MRRLSLLDRLENPRANATVLSAATFWYTIKIFYRAWKRPLKENDLSQPLEEHKANRLGEKFATLWSEEVENASRIGTTPKLKSALIKCFWVQILIFTLVALVLELGVKMCQPIFLKILLRHYSTDNMKKLNSNKEKSEYTYMMRVLHVYDDNLGPVTEKEALFFAVCIIVGTWIVVIISHPYLMGVMHLGMKMRIACCSLVYRKALSIKIELAGQNMAGHVINLISNDVSRFDYGILFLPYLWITPLQAGIIASFLYQEIGLSAIYGILLLILFVPLEFWLGMKVLDLRFNAARLTDNRIKGTNELIQAVQIIKMYTWEQVFIDIICNYRKDELKYLKYIGYIKGVLMSFVIFSFRSSLFIVIVTYVMISKKDVTAEKVFVVSSFLLVLRQSLTVFLPQTLQQGAELIVSISRLQEFLLMDSSPIGDHSPLTPQLSKSTIDTRYKKHLAYNKAIVKSSNASVKLGEDIVLNDINVKMTPGTLTTIIGPVGSGKSCLLYLILGEFQPFKGIMEVEGIISYASQEPWIFPGTIRQNILFGQAFIKKRYEEVCYVCALNTDFQLLHDGDQTFVNEKGAGLSGGQRARVNLARAIYKMSDIYLLDDPLSAVDTHVGEHLFEKCISSYLQDKIVVLVTHQLQYLESVDQIILMKDGFIESIGDYDHLKGAGADFSLLVGEQLGTTESTVKHRTALKDTLLDISTKSIADAALINRIDDLALAPKKELEIPHISGVKWSVYERYFKADSSSLGVYAMCFLFIFTQVIASGSDFFIAKWIETKETHSALSNNTFVGIYSVIILLLISVSLIRAFHFFNVCMRSSLTLHNKMLISVTETRMFFFNRNSSGEILNRFSKDLGAVDELLPNALIDTMQLLLNLGGVMLVLAIISPYTLIPTFILFFMIHLSRNIYLKVSSNVKRLDAVTKGPMFSHMNSTLQGLPTIRSNGNEQILTQEFDKLQDINSSAWFLFIATSRGFGYFMDNICVLFIGTMALSFVFSSSQGSKIGLAITQSLSLTGLFQWGLRQLVEVENQMVSVERIMEYMAMEAEPNLKSDPKLRPPPDWPLVGMVEFIHAYMKYGPQDAHVLNDVNFLINDKEKIGVVGRTGAGKSSLIAALFGLAFFYGEVRISELDIRKLCLHDLRRKISIIPQEPVLFTGTLQYNLDPYSEFDKDSILKVLIDLEVKEAIIHGKACLRSMITEGGSNVSIGQKQVICLARALLRNNKVVVMDEATANIDAQTDKFIQSVIRTKFSNSTVITIAHRLHTIMDADRILVMDAGRVAEFDKPYILLQKSDGIFTGMVEKTGKHMAENLVNIAKKKYEKEGNSSSES